MADYIFRIQDYLTKEIKDIETDFRCKYAEFKGLLDYEVKNTYSEDYAEADGVRLYVPPIPRYKSKECTLRLLFLSDTAIEDSLAFASFVQGRKIEYSDNFRNIFVTLLCTKAPTTGREHLYGDTKYREVTFTFTNVMGKIYKQSQIR